MGHSNFKALNTAIKLFKHNNKVSFFNRKCENEHKKGSRTTSDIWTSQTYVETPPKLGIKNPIFPRKIPRVTIACKNSNHTSLYRYITRWVKGINLGVLPQNFVNLTCKR